MDKLLFKRILVAALTVLAVVYVAYLLISANFDMYPTENAVMVTVTDKNKRTAVKTIEKVNVSDTLKNLSTINKTAVQIGKTFKSKYILAKE